MSSVFSAPGPAVPDQDRRAARDPVTRDTPRTFPAFNDRSDWESRRAFIRRQILISCGLYPLPDRTPLHPHVFDRVEREGYTIEKVSIQTYPGFYLAGNLYRPLGHKRQRLHDRVPGILVAHGHWAEGRMANGPDGSIPARAITFAREGCVAFTYDMVGYNDTRQISHEFANDRDHWLWGISLMGLQSWNSIRALDFVASLPDVDPARLAITGESGGGTQTFILGAIDDRLAAVAPCVMVSHTMQGGCLCENSPGLRVQFSNMEIAAAAAPRPQIMVAATGDWTRTMESVEGPAAESVYRFYHAEDRLAHPIFDFGHNINRTSREAVYRFFGRWLLHERDASALIEPPYRMDPVESLRVFPDGSPLPPDAKDAAALTSYLKEQANAAITGRKPADPEGLQRFKDTFRSAWLHTLQLEIPSPHDAAAVVVAHEAGDGYTATRLRIGRAGRGDSIPALLLEPSGAAPSEGVVLAHPRGVTGFLSADGHTPGPLAASLVAHGRAVLLLDTFLTGDRSDPTAAGRRNVFSNYFTTYNRTNLQERVQDLVTAGAYLRSRRGIARAVVLGDGQAGLWALLAAPAFDATAADCDRLNLENDEALCQDELFVPCLRRLGDFRTAAALAAPHPLLLHNTGAQFSAAGWISDVYGAVGHSSRFRSEPNALDDHALASWVIGRK